MQPDEGMSFEQALERLEEIVKILENQDATLEESVALYKEGANCGKICQEKLATARHELEVWQNGEAGEGIKDMEEDLGDDPCDPF